jgi:8-oxo-dGTP pyrophosphatase MutT (NUDIX family)
VPGGKVDNGENPEDTAMRECFEETGVRCSNLKPLITYDPDLEYTRNHTHVFYTHDTKNVSPRLSEKHKWLPFNDCLNMIERGIITDSMSIITFLAYKVKNMK